MDICLQQKMRGIAKLSQATHKMWPCPFWFFLSQSSANFLGRFERNICQLWPMGENQVPSGFQKLIDENIMNRTNYNYIITITKHATNITRFVLSTVRLRKVHMDEETVRLSDDQWCKQVAFGACPGTMETMENWPNHQENLQIYMDIWIYVWKQTNVPLFAKNGKVIQ